MMGGHWLEPVIHTGDLLLPILLTGENNYSVQPETAGENYFSAIQKYTVPTTIPPSPVFFSKPNPL